MLAANEARECSPCMAWLLPSWCTIPAGRWTQRCAVLDDVQRHKETFAILPSLLVVAIEWASALLAAEAGCSWARNVTLGVVGAFCLVVAVSQAYRLVATQLWVMMFLLGVCITIELPEYAMLSVVAATWCGVVEAFVVLSENRQNDSWRRTFVPAALPDAIGSIHRKDHHRKE